MYANMQPGFQIGGVTNYKQLSSVFSAIRRGVPSQVAKFNDVYHVNEYYEDYPNSLRLGIGAHIDENKIGFAVHHNISESFEVVLATSNHHTYPEVYKHKHYIHPEHAHNVKTGETQPGRLTVFSAGNVPDGTMLPTVHFFDRTDESRPNLWARYCTRDIDPVRSLYSALQLRRIAKQALNEAEFYRQVEAA